ncbi:MAG: biopolymer transporter ExbD [Candidatus Sericytochromatia bacterium]
MLQKRAKKRREKLVFEVIPTIDVMMVLVIFFSIAAFLPQVQNKLDTKLPKASNTEKAKEAIVVNIDKNGNLSVQEKTVSKNEVLKELQNRLKIEQSQPILLSADINTKYEKVMEILEIIKKTGSENVGLVTE